jgi:hypothetical protein
MAIFGQTHFNIKPRRLVRAALLRLRTGRAKEYKMQKKRARPFDFLLPQDAHSFSFVFFFFIT